jgi:molybdopterin/thiamine biosynthesis adenylyltransferase
VSARPASRHVVLVGAGNIGSHLAPHLARMTDVGRVTLIDRGAYRPADLHTQDVTRAEVGRAKAEVQARRLRRVAPRLAIEAIVSAVEHVPLGRLRADVIVAALDSRVARMAVNDAAWRLGVPWIDTGVAGDGWLARVNVYVPAEDAPCMECGWDDRDYAAVEVVHPCAGDHEPPPTGAPAPLGALAAALAALELAKLLAGDRAHAAIGRQVTVDARHHRLVVTRFLRRSECRRADHAPWSTAPLGGPRAVTLAGLAARGAVKASIALEGRSFRRRAVCASCGGVRESLAVHDPSRAPGRCRRCGGTLAVGGFDLEERLELDSVAPRDRARTLASLGIRAGDVLRIEREGETRRFEVGASRRPAPGGQARPGAGGCARPTRSRRA